MAKFTCRLNADFNNVLQAIDNGILNGSISASYEDGSNVQLNGVSCAVRVYERYSLIGSNRVSLNVTLIGMGAELYLTAITSGGSQATFFKLNTIGEGKFLECLTDIIRPFNPQ